MIIANQIYKTFWVDNKRSRHPFKKTKQTALPALNGMSINAPDGKITALLGPNGAGKTTFLRILADLEHPDSGEIYINGKSPALAKQEFTYLSESCGLYTRLTAYENIHYFSCLYGQSKSQLAQHLQTLDMHLDLNALLARKAGSLSLGERMRVSLARAMIHQPQTIVLDEPTNGLDLLSVRRLRAYLQHLASTNGGSKCILLSTHHMHEVEKIADNVIVIAKGKVRAQGSVDEIVQQSGKTDFEEAFTHFAFEENQ
jgi:sodium transport system ATP-binding protein